MAVKLIAIKPILNPMFLLAVSGACASNADFISVGISLSNSVAI